MAFSRFTYIRLVSRLRRLVRNDHLILSVLALIVGTATGAAVIGLREAIDLVQWAFYGSANERLTDQVAALPWWKIILIPTVGGLMVGLFIRYCMPGARPQGIADVIEASALRGGGMSINTGIAAAIASAMSVGVGGSVGREGPAVHLGGSIAGWLGRRLHLTRSLNQTLLGCGVAAAVAASFNAPLAGALFANEVVIGHYAIKAFAPVVIASVAGTAISRAYFGDFPAFALVDNPIRSFWEFPAFIGLGVVSALAAVVLIKSVMFAGEVAKRSSLPIWLRPAAGGFVLGVMAIFLPQVLGIGYATMEDSLLQTIPFWMLFVIIAGKIAATAISIGCGFSGGIFSPSLVVGALLGSAYGILATSVFPDLSSGPPAYAVVGMGAVAAAVMGAPISTTLIIFELTSDYTLTLAVMLAVVISSEITYQAYDRSFFHRQLKQRGIDLKCELEHEIMQAIPVGQIMSVKNDVVGPGLGLKELREALQHSEHGQLFVVESDGHLLGTITLPDLSEFAFQDDLDVLVNAGDVARRQPPVLNRNDDLETAVTMMRETGEYLVAVVEDTDTMQFLGSIRYRDAMTAYNKALIERRNEELGHA